MTETPTRRLTLPKSCRLRHRSLVEPLFTSGKGVYDFPLRIVWRVLTEQELSDSFRDHVPDRIGALQMMITVPKKKRRHAVDRVLMRRRIREAFRLHRADLCRRVSETPGMRTLSMAIIYQGTENFPFDKVEKSMLRLLARISRRLFERPSENEGTKTACGEAGSEAEGNKQEKAERSDAEKADSDKQEKADSDKQEKAESDKQEKADSDDGEKGRQSP